MRNRNRSNWRLVTAAGLCAGVLSAPAFGQNSQAADPGVPAGGNETLQAVLEKIDARKHNGGGPVKVSAALQRALLADYLSEDERRSLRVKHGLWEPGDLAAPADRARAALIAGGYSDAVFDNPAIDRVLRGEAFLMRGEPVAALAILGDASGLTAVRLRAQALYDLARFDDADAAVQSAVDIMLNQRVDDADELAEGVRALMIRARIRGSSKVSGGDFQTLKAIIERGRDELDRLSWRIRLVEAKLLYEKHNLSDAGAALGEVLLLNPRCAAAIGMMADLSINGFAFDQTEGIFADLYGLARGFGGTKTTASPDAAMLEARMRLRQRDPDSAMEALKPARERWPTHRGLLAWHAAAQAAMFDEDASSKLLTRLDGLSPGSPLGHYTVGRVMADARQYDEAIVSFRAATQRLPNWSAPRLELGLVLIQAGLDADAEVALAGAVGLDPFNARARNSLELVRGLAAFGTIESEHFIVRFSPGGPSDAGWDAFLAAEMLPVLESIHARVSAEPNKIEGGIGHEPDRKTLIEIMPSHAWFSVRITGMTRVHTMAAATGPVIAMESPRDGPGFSVGPFDWPRVLQHEYTHTVTLSKTHNRIPHWFTEAAAVFCEDSPRDENTWRLLARAHGTGTLFDLEEINTAFVRPKKPTDRGQAYAQGHWMYQYIVETFGADAPSRLMDRYAAGEREASAFEAELGVDVSVFMSGFLDWARAELRRAGLIAAEGVPTIPEMLDADRRESDDPDSVVPDAEFCARWQAQYPGHPQLAELAVSHAVGPGSAKNPELLDEQIAALNALIEAVPVAELPHRLLARNYLTGNKEDRVLAIPHLEFLNAREQNSAVFGVELAELYAETGNMTQAVKNADRAARISPFDADIREFAARVALKAAIDGDSAMFEVAGRHIEALTVIEPRVEQHRVRLARVREIAGQR